MANRYWIGGTGNINDTAHWSDTSGGTGGFSVPTASDAAFFDGSSGAGTATVNVAFSCLSLDFTGYTGTFAVSNTISLYGSLTLASGMTLSGTQTLTFLNASPATITTAGKTVTFPITFNTASSVGLADNFTSNNTSTCFDIKQGTINTNNYSITGSATIAGTGSTAGQSSTFNLGSSTITLVNGTNAVRFNWSASNGTHTVNCGSATCNVYTGFRNTSAYTTFNLGSSVWTAASRYGFQLPSTGTVNEGTSTINMTSMDTSSMPLTSYLHATKTNWYNLNISGTFGTITVGSSSLGGYSFNNLSITSTAATAVASIQIYKNLLVNGTLTLTGANTGYRLVTYSGSVVYSNPTTSVTITAAAVALTNVDFRNITAAGAATWSGTTVGNSGGNTGITFTPAVNRYAVAVGTGWYYTDRWSATSGGAAGASVPLPQDTAYFDANSGAGFYSTANTIGLFVGDVICTGFTGSFDSGAMYMIGNLTLGSAGSYGFGQLSFYNNGTTATVTTNGRTLGSASCNFGIATYSGGVTFADAVTFGGSANINWSYGDVTFSGNASGLSAITGFSAGFTNNGALTLGGNLTVTTIDWVSNIGQTLSITPGTGTITARNIKPGSNTWSLYDVVLNGQLNIIQGTASLSCRNLTVSPATTFVHTYTLETYIPAITVTGTLTATAPAANKRILVGPSSRNSSNLFTQNTVTITAAAVSLTDCDFTQVVGAGAATWSGTRLGNAGGNSGITFATPKTVYWNFATGGSLFSVNGWAATSGGTPDVTNFPLPQDTGVIEDTGLNTSATVNLDYSNACIGGLSFSTRTNAVILNTTNTPRLLGNITLSSAVTLSGSSAWNVYNCTMNTAGVSIYAVVCYGTSFTLASNVTTTAYFYMYLGTLSLQSYTLTVAGQFTLGLNSTYGPAPTLAFGTGQITSTASSGTAFTQAQLATVSGSRRVNLTGAGNAVSLPSGVTESTALDFYYSGSTSATVATYCRNLDFTGYTGTASGFPRLYGSLTLVSGMTATSLQPSFFGTGSNTITSAGKTISNVTVNCTTGSVTLNDALSCANLSVTSGSFNTSNQNITQTGSFSTSGSASGSITLGTSTVTTTQISFTNLNITVSAASSTINTTQYGVNGGNFAFGNINISGASAQLCTNVLSATNISIDRTAVSGMSTNALTMTSTTISGTFTVTGNSTYGVYLLSITPITISAGSVSLSYVTFQNVTAAGASIPWSGTALRDAGGNTNITFSAARTLYWVGGAGTWNATSSVNWSLGSGGAGGEAAPTAQDNVIFDSNSGSGTVTIDSGVSKNITTLTGFAGTLSIGNGQRFYNFGDATFATGTLTSFASVSYWYVYGLNSIITTNNAAITGGYMYIYRTASLGGVSSFGSVYVNYGATFNSNGYNFTAAILYPNGASTSPVTTVNLGTSVVTLTDSTAFAMTTSGNLTINASNAEFVCTSSNLTDNAVQMTGVTLGKLTYSGLAGSIFTISGTGNTFGQIRSTVVGAHTIKFLGASTSTINDWNVSGTAGNLVTVTSTTTSQFTLVSGASTQGADYLNLSYSIGSPGSTWYAGTHSVDSGNNTGWSFTDEPTATGNGLFFGSNF